MAKKKRRPRYSVDLYDQGFPNEWRHFRSLKKAVRFTAELGLGPDRIVDEDGNHIEGLDLNAPQWKTHRELEQETAAVRARALELQEKLEQEQDAHRNRQITMIQAGYVPIDLIAERLMDVTLEHNGGTLWAPPDSVALLRLSANPGKIASQHKRTPFAAFLQALQNRIS